MNICQIFKKTVFSPMLLCGIGLSIASSLSANELAGELAMDQKEPCTLKKETPKKDVKCPKTPRYYFTGDLLAVIAEVDGLGYAQKIENFPNELELNTEINSKQKNLDFGWDFGFRIGFGYKLPKERWDLYADWTHIHGHGKGHSTANGSDGFMSEWSPTMTSGFWNSNSFFVPTFSGTITSASSQWTLHLNSIDLMIMKGICLTKRIVLTPAAGLTTSWIHQKYTDRFKGTAVGFDTPVRYKDSFKNNFWGLGIKVGFDTEWSFVRDWSFYLSPALSALWGFFDIHQKESAHYSELPPQPLTTHPMNYKNNFSTITPVVDLDLGVRYKTTFCNSRYGFTVQAGWEEHVFFDQNMLRSYKSMRQLDNPRQGNLVIQAITLSMKFEF